MRATIDAGFTTVRDVGSFRAFTDVSLRKAIDNGWVVGPRMHCAGGYITCTGGGGEVTGFAADVCVPDDDAASASPTPWTRSAGPCAGSMGMVPTSSR